MQIKQENKFKTFFKRYGAITLTAVLVFACVLMIGITASVNAPQEEPTEDVGNTNAVIFTSPMTNASVTKDYSELLMYNSVLERFESHLGVDLVSNDSNDVFSVLDGKVVDVRYNSLEGNVVEIEHSDGFLSEYSSLDSNILVKVGDLVTKGQIIGTAGASATGEDGEGARLHFALYKNGTDIDPNNYLDLQAK